MATSANRQTLEAAVHQILEAQPATSSNVEDSSRGMAASASTQSPGIPPSPSEAPLETSDTDEWQIVEYKLVEEPRTRSNRYSPYRRPTETRQEYKLVLLHGRDMFFAKAPQCAFKDGEIMWPAIRLDNRAIPFENLWPQPARRGFLAPNPIPDWTEIKWPRLLDFENGYQLDRDTDVPRKQLQREFHVSEDVRKDPHPNLMAYHGCIMHGDMVTGLCYTMYEESLADRMLRYHDEPLDVEKCLEGILRGMCHLHGIGYLHNSLHPHHIMMEPDDTPVIVNFAACTKEGQDLDIRICPRLLQGRGYRIYRATKANDFGNLTKIREWMMEFVNGVRR